MSQTTLPNGDGRIRVKSKYRPVKRFATVFVTAVLAASLVLVVGAAPASAATHTATCKLSPVSQVVCGAGSGLTVTTGSGGNIYLYVNSKQYGETIGAIAIRCSGGDLGPWVTPLSVGQWYLLTPSPAGAGVCFKLKWGRSWAGNVSLTLAY